MCKVATSTFNARGPRHLTVVDTTCPHEVAIILPGTATTKPRDDDGTVTGLSIVICILGNLLRSTHCSFFDESTDGIQQ